MTPDDPQLAALRRAAPILLLAALCLALGVSLVSRVERQPVISDPIGYLQAARSQRQSEFGRGLGKTAGPLAT